MPMHVLVVDDDPGVRTMLRETLELEGYQVTEAGDGAEALACIAGCRPDIVLLDVHMPILDGPECAARLRAWQPDIPVVAISDRAAARAAVDRHQADGYVAKPFDLDRLLQAVALYAPG